MADFSVDARIKFQSSIHVRDASGSLSVEVFGGPLARVQIALFNARDEAIQGIGFGNFGQPLTTEQAGKVNWLFNMNSDAAYIKWGVQAVRSANNLGDYSVTAKVREANGNVLATSQFSASIADGSWADDIVYDGISIIAPLTAPMPAGAVA